VTALKMSESWDLKLANSKDVCHIVDRIGFSPLSSTASQSTLSLSFPVSIQQTNGTTISVGILGQRVLNISSGFVRYRINRLLACWKPACGTTTSGRASIGFVDDPFPSAVNNPSTEIAAQEVRCSHADTVYRDIEVEWRPIDRNKWYYVDIAAAGLSADQRLTTPALMLLTFDALPTTATVLGGPTLYYDITLEGATSVSATVP